MNISKIETCAVVINPEEAYSMLITMPYEHQRPMKRHRLTRYASDMRNGKWEAGTSIQLGIVDGKEYLIDGQHRLQSVFDSGTPQQFVLVKQKFESMEDLGKAYYRIDSGAVRTAKDAYNSTDFAKTSGLSSKQISNFVGGANFILGGWSGRANINTSRDDLLEFMEEWKSYMLVYASAISQGQRIIQDKLYNAPCVAVALYTCKYQEEKAVEFWRKIVMNDGLAIGTPEHTLLRYIMDNTPDRAGRNIYARKVANAWNAYYKGKSLSVLQVRSLDSDFDLEGTPLYAKGGSAK